MKHGTHVHHDMN